MGKRLEKNQHSFITNDNITPFSKKNQKLSLLSDLLDFILYYQEIPELLGKTGILKDAFFYR